MNQSITHLFFDFIQEIDRKDEDDLLTEQSLKILDSVSQSLEDSMYVVDFRNRCFRFVSSHPLFLCGYSPEEVLGLGYEFYQKVVHPDDLRLIVTINQVTLNYFNTPGTPRHDLAHASFNFRIRHKEHKEHLMLNHKVVPLFVNDKAQMAICVVSHSVQKVPGNLAVYYKNMRTCDQYSFESCKWEQKILIKLTEREKEILKLAKQGKSNKEIAEILFSSEQTVWNQKGQLYKKLNVESI